MALQPINSLRSDSIGCLTRHFAWNCDETALRLSCRQPSTAVSCADRLCNQLPLCYSAPMKMKTLPKLLYADSKGNIFDHPYLTMAGMSGFEAVLPDTVELIPLPEDSRLFTIPDTPPVAWDRRQKKFVTVATVRDGRR